MVEDDVLTHLQSLRIPAPSDDAVARIMDAAKASPRRVLPVLAWLRQLRAALYIPSMRYVIMGGVVGFFILVGLVFQPIPTASIQGQVAENMVDEGGLMALSDMLFDVDIIDEDDWDESFMAESSDAVMQ